MCASRHRYNSSRLAEHGMADMGHAEDLAQETHRRQATILGRCPRGGQAAAASAPLAASRRLCLSTPRVSTPLRTVAGDGPHRVGAGPAGHGHGRAARRRPGTPCPCHGIAWHAIPWQGIAWHRTAHLAVLAVLRHRLARRHRVAAEQHVPRHAMPCRAVLQGDLGLGWLLGHRPVLPRPGDEHSIA